MEQISKVGVKAEYDPAEAVLVHTPNIELKEGMLIPTAALFEGYGSPELATQEHLDFILEMKRRDIKVYRAADVLLDGTEHSHQNYSEANLNDLKKLASSSLSYSFNSLDVEYKKRLNKEKEVVIAMSSPQELVRIILLQPTESIFPSDKNTDYRSVSTRQPLYNLMFAKDQMITTDRGVVLGNMDDPRRRSEVYIMKFVLKKLGITPIYEMQEGKLEGGDFIPCGHDKHDKTFAMIGQGLRTDDSGIEELVSRNGSTIFGYDYIAVVKDSEKSQDEMHLDTYFNILARQKAIALETRLGIGNSSEKKIPHVDIYDKDEHGQYKKVESDVSFSVFLSRAGFNVIPLPEKLQRKYGCNFLTIEPDRIIGVDIGAKADYEAKLHQLMLNGNNNHMAPSDVKAYYTQLGQLYMSMLKSAGLNDYGAKLMPFTHLNKAYGGPHCLTQVLSRIPQGRV